MIAGLSELDQALLALAEARMRAELRLVELAAALRTGRPCR